MQARGMRSPGDVLRLLPMLAAIAWAAQRASKVSGRTEFEGCFALGSKPGERLPALDSKPDAANLSPIPSSRLVRLPDRARRGAA